MGFLILRKRRSRIVSNGWEVNREAADILSGGGARCTPPDCGYPANPYLSLLIPATPPLTQSVILSMSKRVI